MQKAPPSVLVQIPFSHIPWLTIHSSISSQTPVTVLISYPSGQLQTKDPMTFVHFPGGGQTPND